MSKRYLICTSLIIILLGSILLNGVFFYVLKKYYTQFRVTATFPTHENFYQRTNKTVPEKKQKRVVFFGDSRIAQWKNIPNLEKIEWINRGISGETTAQLRVRFEQDVLALNPDVVVLQLGINDLVTIGVVPRRENIIVQQCQDNLKFFVEALVERNIEVILLSIIPPASPGIARLPVWSERIEKSVEKINQYWLDLTPTEQLHVVDTTKVLKNEQGQWHDNVNKDTLHLTRLGYRYLNQAISNILNSH
ncbi:GDSL-type esterase/lipase family protein [Candidatus Parabeggiatoa sp. HSG14]|uniref:SGNH/GDSL hydrolase family protein n=1 Tax=Candidatus Parabeggiatoa sp. HSG14 TaxID=3055593 RepID=UPI0025A700D8|nr:GDSL-type esterase/lipase family protein [Thiotrichales bacterium HSG14]